MSACFARMFSGSSDREHPLHFEYFAYLSIALPQNVDTGMYTRERLFACSRRYHAHLSFPLCPKSASPPRPKKQATNEALRKNDKYQMNRPPPRDLRSNRLDSPVGAPWLKGPPTEKEVPKAWLSNVDLVDRAKTTSSEGRGGRAKEGGKPPNAAH